MRIINNKIKSNDYPREVKCEYCGSELEVEQSDTFIGHLGLVCYKCPVCGEINAIYDLDGITLTINNLKYPDHFYNFDGCGGKHIMSEDEIIKSIAKMIKTMRSDASIRALEMGTADTIITVFSYSGDKEYHVVVAKNYMETSIPYEEVDMLLHKGEDE